MNVVLILMVIVIIVIFIVIAIARSGIYAEPTDVNSTIQKNQTNAQRTANVPINTFFTLPVWSQPKVYEPETSGQCSAYTFISDAYIPSKPSYTILNSGETDKFVNAYNYYGTEQYASTCIDADQLFASTISHECLNPQGISAGAGCILTTKTGVKVGNTYIEYNPGQKVPEGTIEGDPTISGLGNKLYVPCVPSYLANNKDGSLYCQGEIGVVIPNFTSQSSYNINANICVKGIVGDTTLEKDGHYDLSSENCNLSKQEQIFRITRYTLNPDYTLTQNDAGNFASFIHRETGFYLAPELNFIEQKPTEVREGVVVTTTTSYYEFDRPIITNEPVAQGSNIYKQYIKLRLINPVYDLSRNGVYWLLQNQTQNPEYTSQIDALVTLGKGTSDPDKLLEILEEIQVLELLKVNNTGPQQIVYIPDYKLLPTDTTRVWNYLTNSFSINIFNFLLNPDLPILTPYRTSTSLPNSQFISYASYVQDIQIPIATNTGSGNPNYKTRSNPFNI